MTNPENYNSSINPSPQLDLLLHYKGIAPRYNNYAGDSVEISHQDKVRTLDLMGFRLANDEDVEQALRQHLDEYYGNWLPIAPVVTAEQGQVITLHLSLADLDRQFEWQLVTEAGNHLNGHFHGADLVETARHHINDGTFSARQLLLPPVEAGYHTLQLKSGETTCRVALIAAPTRCFEPQWTASPARLAGISLQLYSLKSASNWGVGDFGDLQGFINQANIARLDFIVLNPLHILDDLAPEQCSPYSPMDRRFLNPLYIDLEQEPDFQESRAIRDMVDEPTFRNQLKQLRREGLVDYVTVNRLKVAVLLKMFEQFQHQQLATFSPRGRAFYEWLENKGDALATFIAFQAERSPDSESVLRNPQFHGYLQWLAESQLESCQQQALQSGMTVGLIRDLAVGSKTDSAEVLLNPGLFCVRASIGAPPDPLAPQGQKWGLPPMNPNVLQHSSYRHFVELLKDNMTHCGALRIDHVMALMRLWWSPQSDQSGAGAYVNYPADELFAILRLESQRNQCVVIGEDLGIVPPQVRQLMTQSAIYSNALFYFEKYDGVQFKKPAHFSPRALTMVANHDVPTLAAWWNKSDLELRSLIGLISNAEELVHVTGARESDLIQILHWLNEQDLLPENWVDFNIHRKFDYGLCNAIFAANGRSISKLVCIQPEDMCLMEKPINIPGTSDEYPNWRRKLPVTVEEIFNNEAQKNLLDTFVEARKR